MIELSEYQEQLIAQKLPPHLGALKTKYPNAVFNAADAQDLPPLTVGDKPKLIDFYYGDEGNSDSLPSISFKDGGLNFVHLTEGCTVNPVIQVEVDGNWAYIEIEKQVLLDRMGEVPLPEIEITDEAMIKTYTLLQAK